MSSAVDADVKKVTEALEGATITEKADPPLKKTPMALLHELCKYNKVFHEYKLVDEQGPAHSKIFFVKVMLGDAESGIKVYSASASSIKGAQHSAAQLALDDSDLKKPSARANKPAHLRNKTNDKLLEEVRDIAQKLKVSVNFDIVNRTPNYLEYAFMRPNSSSHQRTFYVNLKFGDREFFGQGPNLQYAKHVAAENALGVLKRDEGIMKEYELAKEADAKTKEVNQLIEKDKVDTVTAEKPKDVQAKQPKENKPVAPVAQKIAPTHPEVSPINQLYEQAYQRRMMVSLEICGETGPPHLRTFTAECKVGDLALKAEGLSKKTAKAQAAKMMVEKLNEKFGRIQLNPSTRQPPWQYHRLQRRTKAANIKMQKANIDYGSQGINPISRLMQIQQAKAASEAGTVAAHNASVPALHPNYTVVSERRLDKHREFTVQCQIGDECVEGQGPNKQLARRSAAEAMLNKLGYNRPTPQPTKSAIRNGNTGVVPAAVEGKRAVDNSSDAKKNVSFFDPDGNMPSAPYPVPNPAASTIPSAIGGPNQMPPVKPTVNDTNQHQVHNTVLSSPEWQRPVMPVLGRQNQTANYNAGIPNMPSSQQQAHPGHHIQNSAQSSPIKPTFSLQTISMVAYQLLEHGSSAAAEAILKTSGCQPPPAQVLLRLSDRLRYLCDVTGLSLNVANLPKADDGSLVCLVTIAFPQPTSSPQPLHQMTSYGNGITLDEAYDSAARSALQQLVQISSA